MSRVAGRCLLAGGAGEPAFERGRRSWRGRPACAVASGGGAAARHGRRGAGRGAPVRGRGRAARVLPPVPSRRCCWPRAGCGVDPGERTRWWTTVWPTSRSISSRPMRRRRGRCRRYLARSLRNRVLNQRARAGAGRAARSADEATERRRARRPARSEHALRASTGRRTPPALSPALQRLAAALEAPLDEEERLLVVWMSRLRAARRDRRPGWAFAPKTAAKRIERLRERLQLAAFAYLERVGRRRAAGAARLPRPRGARAPRPAARPRGGRVVWGRHP